MKRIALLCFTCTLLILSSCAIKVLTIHGDYPTLPVELHSSKNPDDVWHKLIDGFAQKGLGIKIADRNGGLLVSEKTELTATCEKPDGTMYHPDAWLVIPGIYYRSTERYIPFTMFLYKGNMDAYNNYTGPARLYGEWNVRFKTDSTGSLIYVNVTNIQYDIMENGVKVRRPLRVDEYKSTGVFEKQLGELVQ